jgi:DNA invertase Pin-like site-specific DNA recombinase
MYAMLNIGTWSGGMTKATTKRAALYIRTSTEEQSTGNQLAQLRRAVEFEGWREVAVYEDKISGSKGRAERPGLNQLLEDARERKFDVVMAWAIDRLGRSLHDLLGTIKLLEKAKVDLYVREQRLDTTTDEGRLLFSICGALAEFEKRIIDRRIKAGVDRVRKELKEKGSFTSRRGVHRTRFGRPGAEPEQIEAARKLLASGMGIRKAAGLTRLGTSTVHKLAREMRATT